jgi:uncharacterized repeat protein (TIGR03803 family)
LTLPLLQASDGSLVGVARGGGAHGRGTIFRVGLNGGLTVLHAFTGGRDSARPNGGLIEVGAGQFYGVTYGGDNDAGIVYRLDPDNRLQVLHRFSEDNQAQGINPIGRLLAAVDGRLYFTTGFGGGIFRLKP